MRPLSGCISAEEFGVSHSTIFRTLDVLLHSSPTFPQLGAHTARLSVQKTVGNILIFNLESRAEWSNMTEWKEKMEDELETLRFQSIHSLT